MSWFLFLGLSVAAAQVAPNPCTTAAPAPPPPPPPPVVTCSNFQCPATMALKAEAVCPGGLCNADMCCFTNPCTTATTTLPTTVTTTPATTVTTTPAVTVTTTLPTTVTTTPQVTCEDFKCPPKFALKAPVSACPEGQCNADVCCFENPCTTGTTTIPTTVTTTPATTITTTPATTVTTTPLTTVTTTPQLTCEDFKCPAKMALKADNVCAGGLCNADTCCFESPCTTGTTTIPTTVTTTPATTVTTTPAPPVTTAAPAPTPAPPPNPCMPQVTPAPFRLFDAKEADTPVAMQEPKQENGTVVGWALPMIGAVAMLSFAAVFVKRIRRARRDTRAVQLLEAVSQTSDEEAGLE